MEGARTHTHTLTNIFVLLCLFCFVFSFVCEFASSFETDEAAEAGRKRCNSMSTCPFYLFLFAFLLSPLRQVRQLIRGGHHNIFAFLIALVHHEMERSRFSNRPGSRSKEKALGLGGWVERVCPRSNTSVGSL